MRPAVFAMAFAALVPAGLGLSARSARADITYVVQRGHTLAAIAHRYGVPAETIAAANHLKEGDALRPGQTLVIPGVDAKAADAKAGGASPHRTAAAGEPGGRFDRDVVHAVRMEERFHIRVKDGHGKVPATALRAFERLMRQGEATHPPDPRLVAVIGVVSNHFGGRTLEVVSGYRAYKPTQYTAHSNHNLARALDFRIEGVRNEDLRDFCRSLRDTGCGYYPNSTFVHVDVRDSSAYWVDLSRPGERPRYEKLGASADEGTSDVTTESH